MNTPSAVPLAPVQGKAHYFGSLESLRGIAALLVVLYHVGWLTPLYNLGLVRNGYLMVDCFFILSGFVICHSYGSRINTGADTAKFLWLRIGRLYPLHFALIFVALAMECAKYYAEIRYGIVSVYGSFVATNGYSFITNLLLIHDWGFHSMPSFNTPSWSISAEFFVSILFCLILFVVKSRRTLVLVSVAMLVFSLGLIVANENLGLTAIMDGGVFRCLAGFFIGVLVYQAYLALAKTDDPQRGPIINFRSNALPVVFGCLLVTLLSVKTVGTSDFLLLPTVACFLLFVVRAPGGLVDRALSWKPVSWLGKVSYSIYMVHYPILWACLQLTRVLLKAPVVMVGNERVPAPNGFVGVALLVFSIGTVLVISHFSFKWIEEPFRLKSKELAARWFPGQAATPKTTGTRTPFPLGGLFAEAFKLVRFRGVSG